MELRFSKFRSGWLRFLDFAHTSILLQRELERLQQHTNPHMRNAMMRMIPEEASKVGACGWFETIIPDVLLEA